MHLIYRLDIRISIVAAVLLTALWFTLDYGQRLWLVGLAGLFAPAIGIGAIVGFLALDRKAWLWTTGGLAALTLVVIVNRPQLLLLLPG
jgi:hypothetical protein